MDYWVYMLKSIEKKPVTYVGHTKDLKNRLKLHNAGKGAKFEGQGKAKRSEILGIIDREVDLIISTANKDAKIIEGVADSTAAAKYAVAYQNDVDFYELWKTFDVLPEAIGSKSIFWLSTQNYPNSNIFGIRPDALK